MNEILTASTIIVPVVMGVTAAVKSQISDNKVLPIVNVAIGIFIGVVYALSIVKGDVAIYAWAGAISGLSAGGFYDLQANVKGLSNQRKATKLIDEGQGDQEPTFKDGE